MPKRTRRVSATVAATAPVKTLTKVASTANERARWANIPDRRVGVSERRHRPAGLKTSGSTNDMTNAATMKNTKVTVAVFNAIRRGF